MGAFDMVGRMGDALQLAFGAGAFCFLRLLKRLIKEELDQDLPLLTEQSSSKSKGARSRWVSDALSLSIALLLLRLLEECDLTD